MIKKVSAGLLYRVSAHLLLFQCEAAAAVADLRSRVFFRKAAAPLVAEA